MIRVLVVDDHPVVREGLTAALAADPEIRVVGELGTGETALAAAERLLPDVVVMDVQLPGIDGVETCRRLTVRDKPAVVLTTSAPTAAALRRAAAAGCAAFIGKEAPLHVFRAAVRDAAAGRKSLPPSVERLGAKSDDVLDLDPIDLRLLALLIKGHTNLEIAGQLGVAYSTVKHRVSNLFRRLGANRRADLAATAARLGLLDAYPSEPAMPQQHTPEPHGHLAVVKS